jgi:glucose/arabinose dehydrogenase
MLLLRPALPRCIALLAALLCAAPAAGQGFFVERVATGLVNPVFAAAPPGDGGRLFIVEQFRSETGHIRILDLATLTVLALPFLSVYPVATGFEQGLLGLAFHPDYAANRFFYVNFTEASGTTVVRRYTTRSGNPNLANANSAHTVLTVFQPAANHNGGWLGFGPDGYLYVPLGDGGGANDLSNNAQDLTENLLGKILRIDVDGDDFPADPDRNYAIPPDNPFVGVEGDDEIWAYGLRNPWRASFDRLTGDLYLGDVGQNFREEIDVQRNSSPGGENYGWRLREGTIATPGVGGPKPPGAIDPIYDYPHGGLGNAVIGGYVYRGPIAELRGRYFFAESYGLGLQSLVWDRSHPAGFDGTNYTDLVNHDGDPRFTPDAGELSSITSFGEDALGNLYVTSLSGDVFRVTPLGASVPGPAALGWPLLPAALLAAVWLAARRPERR